MTELKPCPFCGSTKMRITHMKAKVRTGHLYGVACDGDCLTWLDCREDTEAEAIAAWNTRTPAPASADAMEVAASFLENWEPGPEMTVVKLARVIQQYGDQCRAEANAAGFRRGVEAAAKVARAALNDMEDLDCRAYKAVHAVLALLETQEKG